MTTVKRKRRRKIIIPVRAPDVLGGVELPPIIATDLRSIIGRTYWVLLSDITGDIMHQFIKCKLKIIGVNESYAYTKYAGHEYFREYIRSLFIRGTSYVEAISDITVKEGYKYRVYAAVFTPKRITNSRKKAIRREIFKVYEKWNKKEDYIFTRDIIHGIIDSEIVKSVKKIYPIRWASIFKVKLVSKIT